MGSSGASGGGGGAPTVGITAAASPSGTTSTTFVMMGLAASFKPAAFGSALVTISGYVLNTGTDVSRVQGAYGTGTAPTNGAAATGTLFGQFVQATNSTAAGSLPFTFQGKITGLTVGTTYWIDLQYADVGGAGGTVLPRNITVAVMEAQ